MKLVNFFFFFLRNKQREERTEITRQTHYKVEIPCQKKTRVIFNKTWTGTIPKKKKVKIRKDNIGIFKKNEKKCSFWVEIFLDIYFFFGEEDVIMRCR